jgi:hypothetical protein
MTNTIPQSLSGAGPLTRLRDLLRLIGELRDIVDPFTSRDGLRRSIGLLLELAQLMGVSDPWTDRVRAIVDDDRLLDVVLAIIQYLLGLASHEVRDGAVRVSMAGEVERSVVVEQQSLLDWLPIVVQIINLLKLIRGDA